MTLQQILEQFAEELHKWEKAEGCQIERFSIIRFQDIGARTGMIHKIEFEMGYSR